ncbi:hypothetical protein [Carp edema virus]|nr:hypothetical protein [Carp edema virus]
MAGEMKIQVLSKNAFTRKYACGKYIASIPYFDLGKKVKHFLHGNMVWVNLYYKCITFNDGSCQGDKELMSRFYFKLDPSRPKIDFTKVYDYNLDQILVFDRFTNYYVKAGKSIMFSELNFIDQKFYFLTYYNMDLDSFISPEDVELYNGLYCQRNKHTLANCPGNPKNCLHAKNANASYSRMHSESFENWKLRIRFIRYPQKYKHIINPIATKFQPSVDKKRFSSAKEPSSNIVAEPIVSRSSSIKTDKPTVRPRVNSFRKPDSEFYERLTPEYKDKYNKMIVSGFTDRYIEKTIRAEICKKASELMHSSLTRPHKVHHPVHSVPARVAPDPPISPNPQRKFIKPVGPPPPPPIPAPRKKSLTTEEPIYQDPFEPSDEVFDMVSYSRRQSFSSDTGFGNISEGSGSDEQSAFNTSNESIYISMNNLSSSDVDSDINPDTSPPHSIVPVPAVPTSIATSVPVASPRKNSLKRTASLIILDSYATQDGSDSLVSSESEMSIFSESSNISCYDVSQSDIEDIEPSKIYESLDLANARKIEKAKPLQRSVSLNSGKRVKFNEEVTNLRINTSNSEIYFTELATPSIIPENSILLEVRQKLRARNSRFKKRLIKMHVPDPVDGHNKPQIIKLYSPNKDEEPKKSKKKSGKSKKKK